MLSRPGSCCPVARRRIRTSSDAVWITDDLLSMALHRFCLTSKSSAREASSTPGPLECRRRLGKRRIANLSSTTQHPSAYFGALWGLARVVDGTEWKWEAPSPRKWLPPEIMLPQFPSLLDGYKPAPLEELHETPALQASIPVLEDTFLAILEEKFQSVRKALDTCSPDQNDGLYNSFNRSFKQYLVLGLVPDDLLIKYLLCFDNCLQTSKSSNADLQNLFLQFYQATWEGIKECRVKWPVDIGSKVLNQILCHLARLRPTKSIQTMANEIVWAASLGQIQDMEEGILSTVRAWTTDWARLELVAAQKRSGNPLDVESNPVEDNIQPLEHSVKELARFLGRLTPVLASKIIHASTDHIISACLKSFKGSLRTLRAMRYSWVSVIANMPCANENLLINTWTIMDFSYARAKENGLYTPSIPRLTLREGCDLLLDFWTSQGQIVAPETVRENFKASILKNNRPDYAGLLLLALQKSRGESWQNASSLMRVLRRTGKPHAVYHVLQSLQGLGVKLSAKLLAREIKELSCIDPRCALNIYKLYHRIRCNNQPLRLDGCPELIIAMVHDPSFDPAEIWGALRIPVQEPLRMKKVRKPLTRARIALVHQMAMAFAQADFRSPRVALRNVMQCIIYLRRHDAPMTADLTRALSHAGITRDLVQAPWIRTGKVSWIIDLIRRVEGDEVATKMEVVVEECRREFAAVRQQQRRRGNPLGVGVID